MIDVPDRRDGALALTLVLLTVGLLLGDRWVLALGVVPLSLVCYDAITDVPDQSVRIERTVDPPSPMPGERTTVTLALTNDGDRPIPDLRVVDGVPETVPVVDGYPGTCVSLRSGESTTIEYVVRARPGLHEFDTVTVERRNLGGCSVDRQPLTATGAKRIEPRVPLEGAATDAKHRSIGGTSPVDQYGEGIEFAVMREYRSGDPRKRIDWRQYAKTGDLATIEYRERGGGTVVLVLDVRAGTARAPSETEPTGQALTLYAGTQLLDAIDDAGDDVGVAAFGSSAGLHWLAPGDAHRFRGHGLLSALARDESAASSVTTVDTDLSNPQESADWLASQVDSDATILFLTPLYDDSPVVFTDRLREHGHAVQVVSPSSDATASVGATVELLGRQARLAELRLVATHVVDWNLRHPLPVALAATEVNA